MRRQISSLVLTVLLLISPDAVAAVEVLRPTPIEVGANMVVCLTSLRRGVYEAHGGVDHADLFEEGVHFATLHRRAFNPDTESWLSRDPVQPPMTLDYTPTRPASMTFEYGRELIRYANLCFEQVHFDVVYPKP